LDEDEYENEELSEAKRVLSAKAGGGGEHHLLGG